MAYAGGKIKLHIFIKTKLRRHPKVNILMVTHVKFKTLIQFLNVTYLDSKCFYK
jgi:hypothetical protein